ncbi:XkdW family protein [Cytobacillus oceanisediminis]|uniref:Bacteriophage SP-beta YorD domain-containing protein n=1 Tax=Cytobacillus oceanisediminis 2691 TaxID=1196031 RepID=A0A160MA33_9BACI|nr:XkdW family protein [Cytobacillus oceanisediminis]AND39629.1 hypothetical protein A361_10930 [Cytobacillus oceanisediminis 2691]
MLNSVLKRYPSLTPNDVVLRDDGEGVYVHYWNSQEPQPTISELLAWQKEDEELPKQPTDQDRIVALEEALLLLMLEG